MAFSFFKKNSQATPQVEVRKPARPAGAPSEPSPSAPPASDFGSLAPSSAGLASLDFVSRDPLDGARRSGKGELQVQDVSAGLHPVVEEAAMLFANGDDEAALSALERATFDDLGSSTEQVWAMLFDLCHALGRVEAFEAHALAYAERFERSAPAWPSQPSLSSGGAAPTLTLSGRLTGASRASVDQLRRLCAKLPVVRVDLTRLQGVDDEGASLLLDALTEIRRRGQGVAMLKAEVLRDILAPQVVPGTPEHPALWRLYIEALQQLGDEPNFEEFAIQYAVTFEQSPPSWDARWVASTLLPAESGTPHNERASMIALCGEVVGARQDAFSALQSSDLPQGVVKVDCSALCRMDFISAGLLFNVITAMQATGRQPRLIDVRPMVAALLLLLGVAAVAEIQQRRF